MPTLQSYLASLKNDAGASAPSAAEVDRRERVLAKVAEIRANTANQDASRVDGKPGMRYIWCGDHPDRRAHYESLGFKLCVDATVKTRWYSNGIHKRGDTILYEIDADTYEAISLEPQLRAAEAIDAPMGDFAQIVGKEDPNRISLLKE